MRTFILRLALSVFFGFRGVTKNTNEKLNFHTKYDQQQRESRDAHCNTEKLKISVEVICHGHLSRREEQSGIV